MINSVYNGPRFESSRRRFTLANLVILSEHIGMIQTKQILKGQ